MSFAPSYLVARFFYRLYDFFHHWYVDGSRNIFNYFIGFLEQLDEVFALRVTLKHFFQPLYKDYSPIGRILGVIFRLGRVFMGSFVYFVLGIVFAVVYFIWVSIPIMLILYAADNFVVMPGNQ